MFASRRIKVLSVRLMKMKPSQREPLSQKPLHLKQLSELPENTLASQWYGPEKHAHMVVLYEKGTAIAIAVEQTNTQSKRDILHAQIMINTS